MMLNDIASRFLNVPIAMRPDNAGLLFHQLRNGPSRGDVDVEDLPVSKASRHDLGYDVFRGVAMIAVEGVLMSKLPRWALGYYSVFSQMCAYDQIALAIETAMRDDDVDAIMLGIDSPGGEVAGCFDLVDTIFALRGEKPTWAILDENAYSAGYAIASACDKVIVPRTGGTGSVGCIMLHVDMSRSMNDAGLTPTIIQYGARKSDGTDVRPLGKEARAKFQGDIDAMGELFVQTVARNRRLKVSAVRATEAATYLGAKGVDVGFADDVMSPAQAFRAFLKALA